MKTLAIAFPILPGKVEQAKIFAEEAMARAEELNASNARSNVRKEEWFIQETPQGAMVIVTMKAEDPRLAFETMAASNDPYDCWFKARAEEISGIDLNQPLPALPERIFTWSAA